MRDGRVPKEAKRVFMDRSVMDGMAYIKDNTYGRILHHIYKFEKIFLIERRKVETNSYRRENDDEARILQNKLIKAYESLGYDLIRIPDGELNERVERIMEGLQ